MALTARSLRSLVWCTLALLMAAPALRAQEPTPVGAAAFPGTAERSSERFAALADEIHALVDEKKLAGVVTLIAQRGEIVHFDAYGKASAAKDDPVEPGSIFRIASMTKPITGVAMMQLYEQSKWALDDPVSEYIPQFADLQVKTADGGTEPMRSPMTMRQLMSHTAGFGASAVYEDAGLGDGDLQDMIDVLAKLPLETQPGTEWDYGPSVNIQGYIVEKLSGESLDAYFQNHIFDPLGMVDTGFWVPAEKAPRVVDVHVYDDAGMITAEPDQVVRTEKPSFLSGSGGLLSTAGDYARFAQALLNGGELEGARILQSETVELMHTDMLPPGVAVDIYGPDIDGIGFGLDFAIALDPEAAGTPLAEGSYYWGGFYGTWFWIDPRNDLIVVGMIQNRGGTRPTGGTPPMRRLSAAATYEALGGTE